MSKRSASTHSNVPIGAGFGVKRTFNLTEQGGYLVDILNYPHVGVPA